MEANPNSAGTVDKDTPWVTTFPDEARARQHAQRLEQQFPKVERAYKPSGKRGALAVPLLFLGSLVGSLVASLAALAVAGLGFFFWGALSWAGSGSGRAMGKLIIWLLDVVVFLVGWFGAFAVAGFVAAMVVEALGRRGKNRSVNAAVGFAIPATLVASAVLIAVPTWLRARITEPPDMLEFSWAQMMWMLTDVSWLHYVGLLLGVGTAGVAAWGTAEALVLGNKFCERCDRYMTAIKLDGILFEELPLLLARSGDEGERLAPPREHPDVALSLDQCDGCHHGYFEATAKGHVAWPNGSSTSTHEASWLCQSFATTPAQTAAIARR